MSQPEFVRIRGEIKDLDKQDHARLWVVVTGLIPDVSLSDDLRILRDRIWRLDDQERYRIVSRLGRSLEQFVSRALADQERDVRRGKILPKKTVF